MTEPDEKLRDSVVTDEDSVETPTADTSDDRKSVDLSRPSTSSSSADFEDTISEPIADHVEQMKTSTPQAQPNGDLNSKASIETITSRQKSAVPEPALQSIPLSDQQIAPEQLPLSPTPPEKPTLVTRNTSDNLKSKMSNSLSWFSRATTTMRRPSGTPTTGTALPSMGLGVGTTPGHSRDRSASTTHTTETLQDRFLSLRMQSEATDLDAPPPASPTSPTKEATSPLTSSRSESSRRFSTERDEKLPPGTAAGVSIGPATEDEGPVNWDLWQTLVQEGPNAVARTSSDQLTRAIKNGIPQPIRGVVWQVLAQSKNEDLEHVYNELVNRSSDQSSGVKSPSLSRSESNTYNQNPVDKESIASSASSIHSQTSTPATSNVAASPLPSSSSSAVNSNSISDVMSTVQGALIVEKQRRGTHSVASLQKLEKAIRRDLGARTSYSKYVASAGMQEPLFRVCKAYALYDEPIGYAQGMNFITMPLLFNMPEEEAFSLLVRLMSNYDLRSMFTSTMTGLHLRLYQFERLLEDFEPALYCHLHRREVSPNLYATQWFLTLFAYRFPLQLVLRIYDLILSEGISAILKFGIVLMQKNAQALLAMKDMQQLTTFLKEKLFDVYIDKSPSANSILESGFFGSSGGIDKDVYHADALIRDACAVLISPETLDRYAAEFEEQSRIEHEKTTELETLRSTNATLSGKVRTLEEQAQQLDKEHVNIASELVRTKVDNESLREDIEGLRTKVDELQKMLETQPAEVEGRLKEEMDRIMARNMEVQNSNRELEERTEEMEKQLVSTKLENAQLSGDRDTLKQKIWSIQNMLGEAKI